MTTAVKREKLVEYIQQADDRKVKAIYTILEVSISKKAEENYGTLKRVTQGS